MLVTASGSGNFKGTLENRKSSVRCKVEYAFRIIQCQFGYKKTVYRGLKKNENRLMHLAGQKKAIYSSFPKYCIQTVGASYHQEFWIPADELNELNRHIIGKIKVI